jgi:hypothetical protein
MRDGFLRGLAVALVAILFVTAISAPPVAALQPEGPGVTCSEVSEALAEIPEFRGYLVALCTQVERGNCKAAEAMLSGFLPHLAAALDAQRFTLIELLVLIAIAADLIGPCA